MDAAITPRDASTGEEPRGTTLTDLSLLVAGFGLWWIIPFFGYQPRQVSWLRPAWDPIWWCTISATLAEGLEHLCLVLAIVPLARKVRSGGMAHPAEFLLIFVAMQLLLTPRAGSMWVLGSRSPTGVGIAALTLGSVVPVIGLWRRCLPGSILLVLLATAYFSLICVDLGLWEFAYRKILPQGWSLAWDLAMRASIGLPGALIFAGPFAAVFWNIEKDRRRWTWIEWCGTILATAWFSCEQIHHLTSALVSDPLWYFLSALVIRWSLLLAAFLSSMNLARRLNPGLVRWMAKS